MFKIDYDYNNRLTTSNPCKVMFFSRTINLCITAGTNQSLSPAAKCPLQQNFIFLHHNICETKIILRIPSFVKNNLLLSSCIPFEQHPKCEICQYSKANHKALNTIKTQIEADHEGSLRDNHLHPSSRVFMDHFKSQLK